MRRLRRLRSKIEPEATQASQLHRYLRYHPTMSPAHKQTLDLALRQHQSGQMSEAEVNYRKFLSAWPNHADALHLLGLALHQTGRHEPAVPLIQKALSLRPQTALYNNSLTAVYLALKQAPQAIATGRRAVQLEPTLPEASLNLGNALSADKQYEASIACYRRAIELRPTYAQAHLGLGNALNELKQFEQAIACYQKAISLQPALANAHYNLGNAWRSLEQYEPAVAWYRQAVALKPDHAEAINNLACTLQLQGHLDQALQTLQQARTAFPHKAQFHSNLGNVLGEANRWDAAIECYDQALVVQSDYYEAKFNRSLALLMKGDFERGWAEYESRWLCSSFPSPQRYTQRPLWRGEPLNGRRILLHAEQGLGDTLQFVRYVPMVAARGGQVILQVQTPLHRLLQQTPGAAAVVAHDVPASEFDVQCPLWSLPLAFGTTLETIPPIAPGLFIDPVQARHWQDRLLSIRQPGHRMNVGLIWSGSPSFANNYRRSTRLSKLAPLAEVNGITFISLQKGPAAAQAADPPAGMRLFDWTAELNDFADTAALMSQLDLIISTDTGPAHLAALMGKPTWILLMFSPDFRWLAGREDCPWYPSARLFRQPVAGDWETPARRMLEELSKPSGIF
jgi:tetratricopeptide (TPR) repeat protein